MRHGLLAAAAAAALGFVGAAQADSINWGQWGYGNFGGTLTGVTADGVGFTITSPTGSFYVLEQSVSWAGIFDPNTPVLFSGYGPGDDHIAFDSPISSFTVAIQSNAYGPYNGYLYAYDASSTQVGVAYLFNQTSTYAPGTYTYFTVTGANIAYIDVGTSNDSYGFGLGGAVPEASTWAMLMLGFAGLGYAGYRSSRKSAALA